MYLRSFASSIALCLCLSLTTASCSKSDDNQAGTEKPGQIPGMGDDTRALEGNAFTLPGGVSLIGQIKGRDLVSDPIPNTCVEDGVGESVMVSMTLQRDSAGNGPLTVEFPAGLIVTTASEGFQHGLLVERVLVTLPPKQPGAGSPQCNVILRMLCLNLSKLPSEDFAVYNLGPVTTSPTILSFINRLSSKKILYSQYPGDPDWDNDIVDVVQHALWSLTDGDGLRERDIEDINALPEK